MCHNTKHPYSPQCTCASCQDAGQFVRRHLSFRERKNLRLLQNNTCNGHCNCQNCNSAAQNGEYSARLPHWRERRQQRQSGSGQISQADVAGIIPVIHLISRIDAPVPVIPGTLRVPEGELGQNKSNVKVVFSIQNLGNQPCRTTIPHFTESEKFVRDTYINLRKIAASKLSGFRVGGTLTIPDLALPERYKTSMALPQQLEMEQQELVEVKTYKTDNHSSMISKLVQQISARRPIREYRPGMGLLEGKYQSIVLDYRGQEDKCALIRTIVAKLKQRLETSFPDVQFIIQIITNKGHTCQGCSPF